MLNANHRRRRSRATLAWAAALFAVLQIAGSLLLDYAWPDLRFPALAAVVERLRQRPSPQIVVLGSSRLLFGSAPGEIESLLRRTSLQPHQPCTVFNAAVVGGDFITSEHVLHRLLQAGARPRLVVLEVMPENFNRFNTWYRNHVTRQLRWGDLPAHFVDVCYAGEVVRLLGDRFFPLSLHRRQIRNTLLGRVEAEPSPFTPPTSLPPGPVDWEALLRPPPGVATIEQAEALRGSPGPDRRLGNFHLGGAGVAAFERTLALCRQRGIEVLLLASPVTRQYREAHSPAIESAFRQYLAAVQQRYPCSFIDCRDWLGDALFSDIHHQHPQGGLYFSRLLTHRALAPWQQRQNPPTVTAALPAR